MTEAEFHRPESWKLHSAIQSSLSRSRRRIDSVIHRNLFRDSFYFLVAALSLAAVIGWLSFVTIAARTWGPAWRCAYALRRYAVR